MSEPWAAQAACQQANPELFFPADGDSHDNWPGIAEARSICASCPVRDECLTEVMDREGQSAGWSRYGLYAGLGPTQRRNLSVRQARARARRLAEQNSHEQSTAAVARNLVTIGAVRELRGAGYARQDIADEVGIPITTVDWIIRQYGTRRAS